MKDAGGNTQFWVGISQLATPRHAWLLASAHQWARGFELRRDLALSAALVCIGRRSDALRRRGSPGRPPRGAGPWEPNLGLSLPALHPRPRRGGQSGHRPRSPRFRPLGQPGDHELYRVLRHAERLEALLESLDLHEVVLAPHDW